MGFLIGGLLILCICVVIASLGVFLGLGRRSGIAIPQAMTPTPTSETKPTETAVTAAFPIDSTEIVAGSEMPETHRIAFDDRGTLHLVWGSEQKGFFHQQMTLDGVWSEAEPLTNDFDTVYGLVDLIRNPAGVVCVFVDAAIDSNLPSTSGVYLRCNEAGEWSAIGERIPGDYAATFTPAVAFTPDGTVRIIHVTGPGRAPVQFAGRSLSPNEGFVYDPKLEIDGTGTYHAMWRRSADGAQIEYRYSTDGGQTWFEAAAVSDMPAQLGSLSLLADAQGNLHVAGWQGHAGAHYKRWTVDGGWEPTVKVTGEAVGGSRGDLAAGTDGLAHIVWENEPEGVRHYVQQLPDGTWSQPQPVVQGRAVGIQVAIGPQGGRHFVWRGEDGGLFYGTAP
jgi:hypothetical protein